VSLQPSAPHKGRRWLALFAIVILATGAFAGTALAAPTFVFTPDDHGANDVPGQKDLTAQSSAVDGTSGDFYTAWKWDDIAWSGNNTGDGCSLFDTNSDGFVDYAVCGTVIGKNPVTLLSVTLYSCNDKWVDRCGGSTLLFTTTSTASTYCTVIDQASGTFGGTDTEIYCDITTLAAAASPAITTLTGGTLLNTCSYPSQQPNSDPSDCVLTPTAANTSTTTLSSGTTTWSATLNDVATLNPSTATGSVVFKLYYNDSTCAAASLIWTSPSVTVTASGTATTAGGGTPNNGNTVSTAGTYYWTTAYTHTGLFNDSASNCGEATVVVAPSVTGSAG
jgi:hypothetical protein